MTNPLAWLWAQVQSEPVSAQYIVQATIGVGTAFGLGWSAPQVAAVLLLSGAILTFLTRKAVTPNTNLPNPGAAGPTA